MGASRSSTPQKPPKCRSHKRCRVIDDSDDEDARASSGAHVNEALCALRDTRQHCLPLVTHLPSLAHLHSLGDPRACQMNPCFLRHPSLRCPSLARCSEDAPDASSLQAGSLCDTELFDAEDEDGCVHLPSEAHCRHPSALRPPRSRYALSRPKVTAACCPHRCMCGSDSPCAVAGQRA